MPLDKEHPPNDYNTYCSLHIPETDKVELMYHWSPCRRFSRRQGSTNARWPSLRSPLKIKIKIVRPIWESCDLMWASLFEIISTSKCMSYHSIAISRGVYWVSVSHTYTFNLVVSNHLCVYVVDNLWKPRMLTFAKIFSQCQHTLVHSATVNNA